MKFFKENRILLTVSFGIGSMISGATVVSAGIFVAAGLFAVADAIELHTAALRRKAVRLPRSDRNQSS